MRVIALACVLFLSSAVAEARAQTTGDAALTYHWVHTNLPPEGGCGCFGLNGGGVSGSWNFHSHWSLVTEISAEHGGNVLSTGGSLTLTSYLAGARYSFTQPWWKGTHAPRPFGQILVGAGHAGGGIAGQGDGTYAFATRMGGGIDVPLNAVIAIRAVQIDYDLTNFANADNDRQNNLLIGGGVVFRWSR